MDSVHISAANSQTHISWVPGVKRPGRELTSILCQGLRMTAATPLLPLYALWHAHEQLYLTPEGLPVLKGPGNSLP